MSLFSITDSIRTQRLCVALSDADAALSNAEKASLADKLVEDSENVHEALMRAQDLELTALRSTHATALAEKTALRTEAFNRADSLYDAAGM